MSSQLHEWDIHIVCRGTDVAGGAGGHIPAAAAVAALITQAATATRG